MAGFLPDSDCMIATVSAWHAHHLQATAEIGRRLDHGEPMFVAAPALVEVYSVLTRLPHPNRLQPSDCLGLLRASFLDNAESVVALDADAYLSVLQNALTARISGGQIYDAVIAACARAAYVTSLLTFNERHFRRFADQGLAIVVPS